MSQKPKTGYKLVQIKYKGSYEILNNWDDLSLEKLCTIRDDNEIKSDLYVGLENIGQGNNQLESREVPEEFTSNKNIFKKKIVFSDEYSIYIANLNDLNKKTFYRNGIQPFLFELGVVYQNHGSIFLNKERIIEPWDDYIVVGRPTVFQNWIYFETRKKPAPQGWEIWRYKIKSGQKEKILQDGANPYIYDKKLFYSKWIQEKRVLGLRLKGNRFKLLTNIYSIFGWDARFETYWIKKFD